MYVQKGNARMPELIGGKWINTDEITPDHLKNKVVLVDFWDYTCVNCIRTLPYIREWNRRYKGYGLMIIGAHAPEFSFSRTEENVREGIREHMIEYPIIMDNDYKIWHSFANKYWPGKYLADKNGYIRYAHFGEGNYIETELAIQLLLREIKPEVDLPDPMKPLRDTDIPGIHCYRVSPELYFGYNRGKLGNPEGMKIEQVQEYAKPQITQNDIIYVEGKWLTSKEYIEPVLENPDDSASVYLKYTSNEVNLVISIQKETDLIVPVMHDDKYLDEQEAGDDIEFDNEGKSYISVKKSKMYNLIKNKEVRTRILELSTCSNGLAMYAFTFTSCVI